MSSYKLHWTNYVDKQKKKRVLPQFGQNLSEHFSNFAKILPELDTLVLGGGGTVPPAPSHTPMLSFILAYQ